MYIVKYLEVGCNCL